MYYGLTNSLGRNFMGARGDDANAYIAAVEAAGATVSPTQRSAIDAFYAAAKADSYYTSLKRLYLPIWGVAAANAIDMISGTSGTFNGGVTHGAGFVQGDGATGYFDMGVSPNALNMTFNGNMVGVLVNQPPTVDIRTLISGQSAGSADRYAISFLAGALRPRNFLLSITPLSLGGLSFISGIITSLRENSTSHRVSARKTSGISSSAINGDTATGASSTNLTVMALNQNNVRSSFTNARLGAFFAADNNFKYANEESFTLALKNLWETTTGLTLP